MNEYGEYGNETSKVYPGTLRGYRWWNRSAYLPAFALVGIGMGRRYQWRTESVAVCRHASPEETFYRATDPGVVVDPILVRKYREMGITVDKLVHGRSPDPGCECGFYAFYRPEEARNQRGAYFGVIEASGTIIPGTKGFRAERARIAAVSIPWWSLDNNEKDEFRETYPSVEVFSYIGDLLAAYPPQESPV